MSAWDNSSKGYKITKIDIGKLYLPPHNQYSSKNMPEIPVCASIRNKTNI